MPPLTLNTTILGVWECSTCTDDLVALPEVGQLLTRVEGPEKFPLLHWRYERGNKWIRILWPGTEASEPVSSQPWQDNDDNLVCEECIRDQFELASDYDYYWPARWGTERLNVRDYAWTMPIELVERYAIKTGDRMSQIAAPVDPASLEGLSRGKDYQLCPGCGTAVCLGDGCNHMICQCLMSFCFVCGGEQTGPESEDHWKQGGCPRWFNSQTGEGFFDDDE